MNTKAGEPTAAIYGLSSLLLKLLREQRPAGVAWAKDARERTFRHAAFSPYKAQRPPMPDSLRSQLGRLDELLAASGAPVFVAPGFEADDVLATLAREIQRENAGQHIRIVTGDRDLFQLARDGVDVLFVGRRGADATIYDASAVEARFGVKPNQRPSLVALLGDPSDNLPKVPGVGEKTASDLIRRFGDAANLLRNVDEVAQVKIREALRAAADQIRETERLARLREDVPLPAGVRFALPADGAFYRLAALFTALEFSSLLPRLERLRESSGFGALRPGA